MDNPCYHCYVGATGQCNMTTCKYQFENWSKDLEKEEIIVEATHYEMYYMEDNEER